MDSLIILQSLSAGWEDSGITQLSSARLFLAGSLKRRCLSLHLGMRIQNKSKPEAKKTKTARQAGSQRGRHV